MERIEIFNVLKDIISSGRDKTDKSDLDKASESSNLRTDIGLDSVGMLYLVISMEEKLGISFDDVSFNDFDTVKDVIDYILNKE